MPYHLYYWPTIQGRGEFVRLALEEAAAPYIDVARESGKNLGMEAMLRLLNGRRLTHIPFAPPFLMTGQKVIAQTANILLFLGARHGLAPKDETGRLWTHQLQLTMADLVVEAHDTHHPVGSSLYYEPEDRSAAALGRFPQEPGAEVSGLLRARTGQESPRRALPGRSQADLRRPFLVSNHRRIAVRLSPRGQES